MIALETGVAAHWGIDQIYKELSEAYRALDWERVTTLFSADAAYLRPATTL